MSGLSRRIGAILSRPNSALPAHPVPRGRLRRALLNGFAILAKISTLPLPGRARVFQFEKQMSQHLVHVNFPGRLVMVGFGSIGQGALPLILRHVGIPAERVTIITADDAGSEEAVASGVFFIRQPLTRDNCRRLLDPLVGRGDFLLNLSVDVSSIALIKLCAEKGALYLDTCIEPWAGGYTDPAVPPSKRTNYALREEALALRGQFPRGPTAVLTHGANPGMVSHFVKQALLNIAADIGVDAGTPASRQDWALLAHRLGIKVVHIAERDTQVSNVHKQLNEFVNTWSVDGFVGEGAQPAELGWGTHEKNWPRDGRRHDFGRQSAVYLMQPGAATRVRTWTPRAGHFHGFLITHSESISISDYLTVREGDKVVYRPTAHYAYHPCDAAVLSVHEFAGRNWRVQDRKRILMHDIVDGIDELGVLLAGHKKNAYWYGSQLSIHEARKLVPHNSATSLQVCVSVLAGVVWAIENPNAGIVEPDDLDFRRILGICTPYLGPVVGEYTDWHPLVERGRLFEEDLDLTDPWQFKNVRVM
jgi:homospermidine synthase